MSSKQGRHVRSVTGRPIPLRGNEIDTDRITGTMIQATTSPLRIGTCAGRNSYCNQIGWIGDLDEVKIWRRALSDTEIAAEVVR